MNQLITNRSNFQSGISEVAIENEKFWVIPTVMITEGVHHGSQGAIYYAAKDLAESVKRWDGKPITLNHPKDANGKLVPATNAPEIGFVDGTRFENGKLLAEAWINQELATKVLPQATLNAMLGGQKVEVSTGLFFDRGPYRGIYGGLQFDCHAMNQQPDHLAILTAEKGACSCDRGCGINANSGQPLTLPMMDFRPPQIAPTYSDGPGLSLPQMSFGAKVPQHSGDPQAGNGGGPLTLPRMTFDQAARGANN